MPLKPVDTAIKVIVGPLIDDTDFKSREESVAWNAAGMEIDVILEKADGTVTVTAVTPTTAGVHDWAHTDQGYYELEIPVSGGDYDNTEEGVLTVVGFVTGVLPFRSVAYDIVPTQVYNSLVPGSDKLQVDAVEIDSTAQRATDLAEIAQYLFANAATLTAILADDCVLAKLLATGGDISEFDEDTDALQAIRDALTAAADALYTPASSTGVVGTEGNTYAAAATDDGTRWSMTDVGAAVEAIAIFQLGTGRNATSVTINGYFDSAPARVTYVYAYNWTTAAYDLLGSGSASMEMRNDSSDNDYTFPLSQAHTKPTATVGEVRIKFVAQTQNNNDVLYLDHIAVTGASAGGTSSLAIAEAVHAELDDHLQHLPGFTGEIYYVSPSGADENSGHSPATAFLTIGAAIAAAAAGDSIIVKAGTYTETGIDMNLAGLELHGEIGAIIDPASGSALTISAQSCKGVGIEARPAAGEIGFDVASGADHSHLEGCESDSTGATGFKVDSAVTDVIIRNSQASGYTGTGLELNGSGCTVDHFVSRGKGGAETGFKLNHTNAHRNLLQDCASIDNATLGFGAVAGADDNVFLSCSTSAGCGGTEGKSDAGANNAWRNYHHADGAELSVAERNAVANALLDLASGIETGYTPRMVLRIIAAALAGKVRGAQAGPTNVIFRNLIDSKDRINAAVDGDGNRDPVTLDGS